MKINEKQHSRYTSRVIQFGKGNFLRGFAEYVIKRMNDDLGYDAGVNIVQSVLGSMNDQLNEQDGLYHLITKGLVDGEAQRTVELIDVVNGVIDPYRNFEAFLALAEDTNNRVIISNTTEMGICFSSEDRSIDKAPLNFPAKLTELLLRRFETAPEVGFVVIPCELIPDNGATLLACVEKYIELWGLSADFAAWVREKNYFANTLVDRIVSGFPAEGVDEIFAEIGCEDKLIVEAEPYLFWAIEGNEAIREAFPADKLDLNVLFVDSIDPYREMKVSLLNAPHTALSPVGFLTGKEIVREVVESEPLRAFVEAYMHEELIPTLSLPAEQTKSFAQDVLDRFANPYIRHQLRSIMLNSLSKYKSRNLPPLKRFLSLRGELPQRAVLALAALALYYRGGEGICLQDEAAWIEKMAKLWESDCAKTVAHGLLSADEIWGEDLSEIKDFETQLAAYIKQIIENGMLKTLASIN